MKKIIELEGRWKAYKYKSFIFYVFIFVFIIFLIFVGLFIKTQYYKYNAKNNVIDNVGAQLTAKPSTPIDNNNDNKAKSASNASVVLPTTPSYPSISFVCRKVITNKLTVRNAPSFQANPVGYYSKNGIFCAENKIVNGLVQTSNGWISANDKFSKIVEVNMFVDSGFYKYKDNRSMIIQAPMQEINVLNSKTNTIKSQSNSNDNKNIDVANNVALGDSSTNNIMPLAPVSSNVETKPSINISSEKITKEREIELKIDDFKTTNSYDTAIEIAEYYFSIKDYVNSIKWALNASEANSQGKTKAQSFIVYAKSLYASGKKDEAIDVLNKYISKTNSRDAIEALKNIRQGLI